MVQSVWPILLTISGAVLYHFSSKSVPRGIHPMTAIIVAYVTAILACLVAAWRWPANDSLASSLRQVNWAVGGIGLGAALIEVGFLLAYRSGWPLNIASIMVNVAAALVLVPLGFAAFGERLSVAKGLGIVLCLGGLYLISRE
jgi:uncharacterized membrane protein